MFNLLRVMLIAIILIAVGIYLRPEILEQVGLTLPQQLNTPQLTTPAATAAQPAKSPITMQQDKASAEQPQDAVSAAPAPDNTQLTAHSTSASITVEEAAAEPQATAETNTQLSASAAQDVATAAIESTPETLDADTASSAIPAVETASEQPVAMQTLTEQTQGADDQMQQPLTVIQATPVSSAPSTPAASAEISAQASVITAPVTDQAIDAVAPTPETTNEEKEKAIEQLLETFGKAPAATTN